jgi:uncharacterized protein YndB with AHSA1/START domain
MFKTTPDLEIVSTRIVYYPRDLVFRAWTEPDHLKKWWGPAGFTNTFFEYDFRPGGRWRFMMHGPDRGHYPNECEFITIEKPSLLHWNRISKPHFQVMVNFDSLKDNETKITFRMIFTSAEECNKIKIFAVEKNEENFDRLENELKFIQPV